MDISYNSSTISWSINELFFLRSSNHLTSLNGVGATLTGFKIHFAVKTFQRFTSSASTWQSHHMHVVDIHTVQDHLECQDRTAQVFHGLHGWKEFGHTMSSSSEDAKDRRLINVWDLYGAVQCLLSILCKASLNLQASRTNPIWCGVTLSMNARYCQEGNKDTFAFAVKNVPSASHLAMIGVLKSPCSELSSIGILPPAGLAIVTLYPASCKVGKSSCCEYQLGWSLQQEEEDRIILLCLIGAFLLGFSSMSSLAV